MSLLYRLLLAHIIADFPLQTKQIFNVKMNTKWGLMLHTLTVLIFSIIFTFPYLENPRVIAIILIVFVTHTIIDKLKLEYSKKTNNQSLGMFLFDQVLHIAVIIILTFNFSKTYLLSSPSHSVFLNYLIDIYNNDIFIINLIGYIASVFFIPILLIYVKEKDSIDNLQKLDRPKTINIKIPTNQIIDKLYRLFLTISAQYLDDQYIIIIFIGFIVLSFISYQLNPEKTDITYNLKRITNSSLAIFIGITLKMI